MRRARLAWLLLGALLCGSHAQAALNLMRTRIIYEGGAREASLMVDNPGPDAALLQAWIDGGDENQGPAEVSVPFLVVPPLVRLGPDRGQTLRVLGADLSGLPRDRESLFWLNVLGLPPKASASQASVQLAYRTRIKLFYRPAGLAGTPVEAVGRLIWRELAQGGVGVTNPGPFYVNLSEVLIEAGAERFGWHEAAAIPPYGEWRFPLSRRLPREAKGRLRWIDDEGNYHEQGFLLTPKGGDEDGDT